ncbi:IS66 family transposase, partial [Adlercreutzia sp. ZJ473]|uniref:IS66 family transposase n=1 Tax=Adlercreutzia sp. ZJ473 TaxID=2722822 RepID=UPI00155224D5
MTAKIERLEAKMARLVEMLKLANMRFFGSKSEKVVPDQLSLFNDTEAWADPAEAEPELDGDAPAKPRRRGGRRRIDTADLERVVIEHTLEDASCPHCGSPMSEMKVEVTEVIRLVPAHLVVEEHRRHAYKCGPCCKANAKGEEVTSQIVRAPMPELSPIPRSFATASMLSYVLNAKYANSMPYYRLEEDFRSIGADISRQDMANWTINVHERWLSLIHSRMKEKLLECRCINADETEVQVLKEPDRLATKKSYMWLFRSGPHETPNCIFEYHPTRSGDVARTFLKGWSGYLTTDGYDPYFNLGIDGVVNTACLVHIRRRFAEIVKVAGGDAVCEGANSIALEARRRIDRIFRIDKKLGDMDPESRKEARLEKLAPHMESFEAWAEAALDKAVPRMALHEALLYAIKYWPYVMNVLEDGRLGLDNNIAERAVKSFVIGRKNWLFSGTPRGANASAAIYSI